jgi:hypothetical protein
MEDSSGTVFFYPSRPTFVFLKGPTKVDEVRGANKAYALYTLHLSRLLILAIQ